MTKKGPKTTYIYRHKTSECLLRLHKKRPKNVNIYIVVDENNKPILKKNICSFGYSEQHKIVTDINKLEKFPCTKCI